MKSFVCIPRFTPSIAILIVMVAFLGMGFFSSAYAGATSPAVDASCTQMQKYGFTTGLVYCVQTSIGNAVTIYVAAMQKELSSYEFMAMAVAIMLFGIKMMNSHVQEPLKEGMTLLFRILIGVFFYNEAGSIYNDIAGTLPSNNGIMNEAIGWITGFGSSGGIGSGGSGESMFSTLITNSHCTADAPPEQFEGYQVWQAFDCIFSRIFGAANPATHPYAFTTSLLIVIGAALLSATTGVIATGLGITVFIGALMLVFRALYLVLLSYICIGFMAIFAPLFAPLIFFESKFLTEKFKRWLGTIISCIFQPVLVIGFLALAITVDDQIIEGTFGSGGDGIAITGCNLPTYPGSGASSGEGPALGYGQDGSGVCSFTQLFYNGDSGEASSTQAAFFSDMMEQNHTLFKMVTNGSPAAQNLTNSPGYTPLSDQLSTAKTNQVNLANQFTAGAGSMEWSGTTRLKKYVPLRQLLLTLLTFIFATFAMLELMKIIPQMASQMTIAAAVDLAAAAQVPFEGMINRVMEGAQEGAREGAEGKGLLHGNMEGYGKIFSGALKGAGRGIIGAPKGSGSE